VEDAIDTFRNQRVWATAASTSRFPDRYICPLCRTEVALASGPFVCKHFRHLRGTDHDECERYSKNFGREVPLSQHEYEYLDAVLVANQAPTNGKPFVSLAVRFRPTKKTGRVKLTGRVDFLAGERSTPYTIQLSLRQQYFRITSPEKNYLIKAKMSDGGDAQYPVEGFDEKPAVFRATEGESVRIADHRQLKPGGHIVISRKAISSFHTLLAAQALPTLAGLHAALIQIPENPNRQVRENIRSLLHFEITAKMATYGFLSPASAYELATDCWEVARDAELAIVIKVAREGGPRYSRLLVQHRVTGHLTTEYLTWNDDLDEFVIQLKPSVWKTDVLRIGLATNSDGAVWFLLEINFSDDTVSPQCARIQFQFASGANDKIRLKWSAHELPKMLMSAVRGTAKLLAIGSIPEALEIRVGDARGQRVTIPHTAAAEKLLAFLRQSRFPCALSASGHPDIILGREKRVVEQPNEKAASPSVAPRCRREARLRDAYKRGHTSAYSIRSMAL
jgi:hypothetical protein